MRNLFPRPLFPLVALSLYLAGFAGFLAWFLPEESPNVTDTFINHALWLTAGLAVASHFVHFVLRWTGRLQSVADGTRGEWPKRGDLFLILLPLTPVMQYALNNRDILPVTGTLQFLAIFGAFSVLFVLAFPAALRSLGPVRPLIFLGLAFAFTVTHMATLSARYHWFESGRFVLQAAVFVGVFLVGIMLYRRVGPRFTYAVVVLYFLSNSAVQFGTTDPPPEPVKPQLRSKLIHRVGSRQPATKPNIYLLVYDSYVANETMAGYGLDNRAQEKKLQDSGFKLYPKTYSVGGASIETMSRVLNASLDFMGDRRLAVSGNGVTQQLLQGFGYETHGVFTKDYFFQTVGAHYDHSYPGPSPAYLLLTKAVFMGEFRFDVEYDRPSRNEFADYKEKILGRSVDRPQFVYLHDDLPGHSQNSGECRPEEIELFAERLEAANREMDNDIGMILGHDPDALIIVAGDHGPYLTKNCYLTRDVFPLDEITRLDIQDRYGTFLAIRWPGGKVPINDDIVVLQDVFHVVFGYLLGDLKMMKVRVRASIVKPQWISGASVTRGTIRGGVHDREPLFLGPPTAGAAP